MIDNRQRKLGFEQLEDRLTPAVLGFLGSGSLTLLQRGNDGPITVTSTDATIQVTDGASALMFNTAGVNNINIFQSASDLVIDDDGAAFNPNLTVTYTNPLGGAIDFTGSANNFNNVRIRTSGNGGQLVDLTNGGAAAFSAMLLNVDLGAGFDTLSADNGINITWDVYLRGVNFFDDGMGPNFVGRNLTLTTNNEALLSAFIFDDAPLFVAGSLTYNGGGGDDVAILTGAGTSVIGAAGFYMGNGTNAVAVGLNSFGRSVTVTGGSGSDSYSDDTTNYGGSLTFRMGDGTNAVTLSSTSGFDPANVATVSYVGGVGTDTFIAQLDTADVTYATLSVNSGGGADTIILTGGTGDWYSVVINTGAGNDTVEMVNRTINYVSVYTGDDNDTLDATGVISRMFSAQMGAGNDTVTIDNADIARLFVDLGTGADTLNQAGAVIGYSVIFDS